MRTFNNANKIRGLERNANGKEIVVLSVEEFIKYTKPKNIVLLSSENLENHNSPTKQELYTIDEKLKEFYSFYPEVLNNVRIDNLFKLCNGIFIPSTYEEGIDFAEQKNAPLIYLPRGLTVKTEEIALDLMANLDKNAFIALPNNVLFSEFGPKDCCINQKLEELSHGYFSNLTELTGKHKNKVTTSYLSIR